MVDLMNEPIKNLLHSASELKISELQDNIVRIIFDNINATMHGGTAIWRCYGGKRFSEDIDLYVSKESYIKTVANRIALSELRIRFNRRRKDTIYYDIFKSDSKVSLQIKIAKKRGVLVPYEMINGIKTEVYSLSPEELIIEKIEAYADRRLIRDIYDIMILTKSVLDKQSVIGALSKFLSNIAKPKDENILKDLIYTGTIPSFFDIVEYLNRWCRT